MWFKQQKSRWRHALRGTIKPDRRVVLGPAWAGSSVNCKPYAVEPIIYIDQAVASPSVAGVYFDDSGMLCLYRIGNNELTAQIVRHATGRLPKDAHDTPVLQTDQDGRIHVFASSHRSRPLYLRSGRGADLTSLADFSATLPEEMAAASYPSLLRLPGSGQLYLFYRLGQPAESEWRILSWSNDLEQWAATSHVVVTGMGAKMWPSGPYPNQPILYDNDTVGLVLCWRSTAVEGGVERPRNIGFDYVELTGDLMSARTGAGLSIRVPVSPSNSERIIAVSWDADLINQSGACAIDGVHPCFASAWRSAGQFRQVQFCWRDLRGHWCYRNITNFRTDSRLESQGTLPLPFSRPLVVPAGHGKVLVLYRTDAGGGSLMVQPLSAPDFDPGHYKPLCLVNGGLDQYEPVVERLAAARSGWLHVYAQSAKQTVGGDAILQRSSEPASLLSWRIDGLLSMSKTVPDQTH